MKLYRSHFPQGPRGTKAYLLEQAARSSDRGHGGKAADYLRRANEVKVNRPRRRPKK